MKENERKRKEASSESYVDAVVPAENVVGYMTDCWQKGLACKETHPKKSCRGSKGPFHSNDKARKN